MPDSTRMASILCLFYTGENAGPISCHPGSFKIFGEIITKILSNALFKETLTFINLIKWQATKSVQLLFRFSRKSDFYRFLTMAVTSSASFSAISCALSSAYILIIGSVFDFRICTQPD